MIIKAMGKYQFRQKTRMKRSKRLPLNRLVAKKL